MGYQQLVVAVLLLVANVVLAFPQGDTSKMGSPSHFTSSLGSGWGGRPISSTSSGFSGMTASQEGLASQSISLQGVGTGMSIGLISDVLSDGFSSLAQSGGNSEEGVADVNSASGTSGIIPSSSVIFEIIDADAVNLDLDSQALGWEEVDTAVQQQASVTVEDGGWTTSSTGGGGWTTSSTGGGGWTSSAPDGKQLKNEASKL